MVQTTGHARPQVIFLDAVGTLFGVQGSVGAQYSQITAQFGVTADPGSLDRAFYASFKAAPPCSFPGCDLADIPAHEFRWWKTIAIDTFQRAELFDQFADFDAFFEALFAHFATAAPWFLYPDVRPTLDRWHQMGLTLAVLSNFDSRLYPVLQALELQDYFASITISTEAGAAKPDRQIFDVALQKHQCPAAAAWHIGDSYHEDFQASRAAGLRGIWLKRG